MGELADAASTQDRPAVLAMEVKEDTIPGAWIGIFRDPDPAYMVLRLYDGSDVEVVIEQLRISTTGALVDYWKSLAQATIDATVATGADGATDLDAIRAASYLAPAADDALRD